MAGIFDLFMGNSPAAPDFQALANQQMQAGRPNQATPFGFSNWSQDDKGNWSQQTGFSPELQGLFSQLTGAAGKGLAGGIGTGDDAFKQAFGASWENAQQNLLPQLQQHFDKGRSDLANQGVDVGNRAAYGTAMQGLDRDYASGLTGAWQGAMQQGLGAQAQTYQQNKDAYAAPFSLMGGMQGMLQMPGFQTAGNYQTAGQQQFDASQQRFGSQQAGLTGLLQGAGDIGAAYLSGGGSALFGLGGGGALPGSNFAGGSHGGGAFDSSGGIPFSGGGNAPYQWSPFSFG